MPMKPSRNQVPSSVGRATPAAVVRVTVLVAEVRGRRLTSVPALPPM